MRRLIEWDLPRPALRPGDPFDPGAASVGLVHQLREGGPEPAPKSLALGLQPAAQLLTSHLLRAGEEVALPELHRLLVAPALDLALELRRVELQRLRAQRSCGGSGSCRESAHGLRNTW